ncbi:MAG: peptidoglycan-associated lipoprotein [Patiriisocius sp.]|jgi:peptidoglycan-associated lipoprotein
MKMIKHILFGLFVLGAIQMNAQDPVTPKEKGEHYFKNEGYYTAIDFYKKAYALEKNADEKARLIYMVGESYRMLHNHAQAETWYLRAIKGQHKDIMSHYYLGKSLQGQGRYKEAQESFDTYIDKGGDPSLAKKAKTSCEYAISSGKAPSAYEVTPEMMLNTEFYDFAPLLSVGNGEEIIFSSSRQGATGLEEFKRTGESFEDLFMATRDQKGKWSEPVRLGTTVNTPNHEGGSCLAQEGQVMYFTRCPREEDDGCDIYMVAKTGDKWGAAQIVPFKGDDQEKITIGHPSISADGKYMVFASDLPGTMGGKDIFITVNEGGTWGTPKNLGPGVNTTKDELFPHLRNNGKLYFSSMGRENMGGLDIFEASKTGDMEWGDATNMGYPINTNGNDFSIIFDGDDEKGFFSSDRQGGKGMDDIYSFTLPKKVFAFSGYVYDKQEQFPLEGAYIKVVGSDGSSFQANADGNGAFNFADNGDERYINPDVNYTIEVGLVDYLVAKDNISTVGMEESTTFVKEYFLQSTKVDEINFPEVQYDLGSAALKPASKDSLNFLLTTLVDNPTIIIELAAHTDSRGQNNTNQKLSDNRAQSCVDYLISKGIPSARMKSRGYGETKLKVSDAAIRKMSTTEEKEAGHQKNRRTVFRVLSWDYVPN